MNLNIKSPQMVQLTLLLRTKFGRRLGEAGEAYRVQHGVIKKLGVLLLFFFVFFRASGQTHYEDSVKSIIAHTKNDSIRLDQYMQLSSYYSINKPDSSITYAEKVLQWGKVHADRAAINYGLFGKGYAYYKLGNFPAALKLELRVLQDFERDTNKVNLANLYNSIGNIYKGQQNFTKALYYYHLCKNMAEKIHDRADYGFSIMNMAYVYSQTNKLDSAIYYSNKFISSKSFEGYGEMLPYVYSILGDVYFKQKIFNPAYTYYHKGLLLARQAENLNGQSDNVVGLSKYFKRLNNIDSALYYASMGVKVSKLSGYKLDLYKSSLLLAGIYESDHRLDSAYKYLKISMATNDSLYNAQKTQDFANATTDESARQDAIKAAVKDYNDTLRIYALVGVTIVILLIAFFLWRNSRNQKKAYNLLSRQKKEIDTQKEVADKALIALKLTQNQLIQSEKMASLGALTAGIAHEIQNPLNFVTNFSEVSKELMEELNEELEKGDIEEARAITTDVIANLGMIHHHGKRADNIVKGMLEHSRTSAGTREPTDVNKLAEEYVRLAYHGLRAKDKSFNAELETNFDPALPLIPIISQDIGRVLLNLFNNAFYSVRQKQGLAIAGYKPAISVSTLITDSGIQIIVKDNGVGVPEANRDKIMQPFFTTKPTGEGIGLGLSLSYDIIVKGHNGDIAINSVAGEGVEFVIQLPLT